MFDDFAVDLLLLEFFTLNKRIVLNNGFVIGLFFLFLLPMYSFQLNIFCLKQQMTLTSTLQLLFFFNQSQQQPFTLFVQMNRFGFCFLSNQLAPCSLLLVPDFFFAFDSAITMMMTLGDGDDVVLQSSSKEFNGPHNNCPFSFFLSKQ